jgi:hypothetical protein
VKRPAALVWTAIMLVVLPIIPGTAHARQGDATPDGLWSHVAAKALAAEPDVQLEPGSYSVHQLDVAMLETLLMRAPVEFAHKGQVEQLIVTLPLPDGSYERFSVEESSIMEPELAAKFPEIKTYAAQGLDDPTATVRFDLTPAGFHAQIISARGTVYIDPYRRGETATYVSYDKRGYRGDTRFECLVPNQSPDEVRELEERIAKAEPSTSSLTGGGELRTYRLACAATGEYTAFHGGTVSAGMSAITTAINRVNGVYERELSVRMILVANNDQLVYTNAKRDPYANTNGSQMLGQNQNNIDNVIGSANYDIGHVFSTGGGGVAYLRSVCNTSLKAGGVTGLPSPTGDAFYIDYVAHEMGHQYGANHTFNECGSQRNASTAYEPGSGTTIMGYAGICGSTNVALNSDDYFHGASLDEIYAHIRGAGGCRPPVADGNDAPTANAGADYRIPVNTPFTLTGSASDPNGDAVTYCWEQWDLGSATSATTKPLFRSRAPSTDASRTLPSLADLYAGSPTTWEALPTVARTLNFRLTARDNNSGGGGVDDDFMVVDVTGTQSFSVTAPAAATAWPSSSSQTVTWNVSDTPAYCSSVRISLSTNNGASWTTLATSTANDGSETITAPNVSSNQCRVRIEGIGNIFFNLSPLFTIGDASPAEPPAAPSNLIATALSTSQINLTWSDNSTDETEFKIDIRTSTGAWTSLGSIGGQSSTGTVGATVTGLSRNTLYVFRVRASNTNGDSAYSNEASARTLRR